MSENKVTCPKCGRGDQLWEGAEQSGYFVVDEYLERKGGFESDGAYVEATGEFGCAACQWVGSEDGLLRVGLDGKPLLPVIQGQLEWLI
jgi:hypothetical protein